MPIIREGETVKSDLDGLYSEESDEPAMSDTSAEEESEGEDKGAEPHTELISDKLVMGKDVKAGDKIVLEVVKSYGNEIEVRYASEDKDEPEDDGLDSLAT